MSTRANIIIKNGNEKMYFYRHSDGYPEGTMPTLEKFVQWMKEGKIRNNVGQGAGWLIILGAIEYTTIPKYETEIVNTYGREREEFKEGSLVDPKDWKVGAYEPTDQLHGDIEYLYTIDMVDNSIKAQHADFDYETGVWKFTPINESEITFANF